MAVEAVDGRPWNGLGPEVLQGHVGERSGELGEVVLELVGKAAEPAEFVECGKQELVLDHVRGVLVVGHLDGDREALVAAELVTETDPASDAVERVID